MKRLIPGMLIKTNYSGPYRIESITRGCECPSYLNTVGLDELPKRRPHIHLALTTQDGTGKYWLNGWDEETLTSLEKSFCGGKPELGYDTITILPSDKYVQMELF
jgi:hypothetical protein